MIRRFFEIDARGSTVGREVRGGFATFLTMSYILVANPAILARAGMPAAPLVASTAAAAGIACLLMGLVANFPIALASGMGLNAVVAFQIAKETGSWQAAMGLVVLDGVVILVLVLLGLREAMLHAIPEDLRRAIGAGIGLFIAFIGAVNAHIVVPGVGGPPVTYGSLASRDTQIALAGLVFTAFLMARKVKGAILLGILFGFALALGTGVATLPKELAAPSFEVAFHADVLAVLKVSFVPLLLALLLVDFFDTLGTVTAISAEGGLRTADGRIPRLRSILVVDSLAASIGGLFGASSVTSYIESAAGVGEGARTGLHSVVVGLLFLACIFVAPFAAAVPSCATAPALILVGFLMASQIARIDFERLDTAIPAFVTLVTIPFTYSIAHGIGYGFITFVAIRLLSLRFREIHPLMACAAAAFAGYFIWG
ncbi:MAG: NCS2 family permease [Planctomycetota bacterium]